MTEASSIASGLSCASRIFNAEKFNIEDSSEIVPLSIILLLSFFVIYYSHENQVASSSNKFEI